MTLSSTSQLPMPSPTPSRRIKETKSTNADVEDLTKKISTTLLLAADPATSSHDDNSSEEDWEKLADKELDSPAEPVKAPTPATSSTSVLELYDFEPRIPMHQLVKEFTSIVDPTETMSFRPKMVNQCLILTFQNPKHGILLISLANVAATALYNYSCITPQNPIGTLRRSNGEPKLDRSSSANCLPPAPPSPSRVRDSSPRSRPVTTDSVARRFIAGHLGIRAAPTPERREYDKLVLTQAQKAKEEQAKQKQKEMEEQKKQEQELKNVWEQG
jgi:hypothetical protein